MSTCLLTESIAQQGIVGLETEYGVLRIKVNTFTTGLDAWSLLSGNPELRFFLQLSHADNVVIGKMACIFV